MTKQDALFYRFLSYFSFCRFFQQEKPLKNEELSAKQGLPVIFTLFRFNGTSFDNKLDIAAAG